MIQKGHKHGRFGTIRRVRLFGVRHNSLINLCGLRSSVFGLRSSLFALVADRQVEWPTEFELIINLKAAKQIGVTIPDSVLFQADKVIK